MTKKKTSHLLSHRIGRRGGDTRELAESLAPLEELVPPDSKQIGSKVVAQETGAIVVGRQMPALPEDVFDRSNRNGILRLEPVVIVIVGLMLAFIVFIAWQISQMPALHVTN